MQDRETTPEERIPALQDNATYVCCLFYGDILSFTAPETIAYRTFVKPYCRATGKSGRMSRLTKTMSRLRSRTHRRTTSTASALHAENSFEDDVEKTTTSISEPVPYSESFRSGRHINKTLLSFVPPKKFSGSAVVFVNKIKPSLTDIFMFSLKCRIATKTSGQE